MSGTICSILSASLCAYGIGEPGGVRGSRFAPKVGFTDASIESFTAGPDQIDACYVGDTPDSVILAFRGTFIGQDGNEEQAILDWLNDFLAIPVKVNHIPGNLHQGFSDSVGRLFAKKHFQDVVQQRIVNSGKPIIVTGYSKGAALAPIAAAFLNTSLSVETSRMAIYMFEPPRPGNAAFAEYFKTFPTALRYEYQDDIVPHVPPVKTASEFLSKIPLISEILEKYADIDEWNYTSVGELKFVNWDNKIVADSPGLARERLEHLEALVVEGKVRKMGADHMPCGHIYNFLCKKDCPPLAEP